MLALVRVHSLFPKDAYQGDNVPVVPVLVSPGPSRPTAAESNEQTEEEFARDRARSKPGAGRPGHSSGTCRDRRPGSPGLGCRAAPRAGRADRVRTRPAEPIRRLLGRQSESPREPRLHGTGLECLRWAFTTYHMGVYQPLAWIFLEAEYVLWGLAPWGYHLTSLVFYVAEAVALYALTVVLLIRCRAIAEIHGPWPVPPWRGLAVALFVAHPLRDEVVAWVSDNPTCPRTVRHPGGPCLSLPTRGAAGALGWSITAAILFVAAMMSKAVAVTLPVVFLILDVYPLRGSAHAAEAASWQGSSPIPGRGGPGREIGLHRTQRSVHHRQFAGPRPCPDDVDRLSPGTEPADRGASRSVLRKYMFVTLPRRSGRFEITALYILPPRLDWTNHVFRSPIMLVAVVSVTLFLLRRSRPAWLAAWLSYLVILAPTSGLRQIGAQMAADRYSYMAMFGWWCSPRPGWPNS